MSELKITVDHLKNYLGTGLILEYSGFGEDKKKLVDRWSISIQEHWDIHYMDEGYGFDDDVLFYFKPICYRLSDLDKEIEHNGERFVPIGELSKFTTTEINNNGEVESAEFGGNMYVTNMPDDMDWYRLQRIFEWHFWPFGDEYFEQGLVIDKMKISKK